MKEREPGFYWVLPPLTNFWEVCQYDANWNEWRRNGDWGWIDGDFDEIYDSVKIKRNARQEDN